MQRVSSDAGIEYPGREDAMALTIVAEGHTESVCQLPAAMSSIFTANHLHSSAPIPRARSCASGWKDRRQRP